MVTKDIIETIASHNKEFVHSVVEGRSISKEEVKNFIVDLLGNCGDNTLDTELLDLGCCDMMLWNRVKKKEEE